MNSTKKGFMMAGSIIAMVVAGIAIIMSLILLSARSIIDTEFVTKVINEMNATNPADPISMTQENIDIIMKLSRILLLVGSLILIALAVIYIVFGVKVIKLAKAGSNKKGPVITLLVFAILGGNLLVVAFMIVSLCLKFKEEKPETPEIEVEAA